MDQPIIEQLVEQIKSKDIDFHEIEIKLLLMYYDENFAIYEGDKFLYAGRIGECAEYLNIDEKYVYFLSTSRGRHMRKIPYEKRIIIIRVDSLKDKDKEIEKGGKQWT